MRKNIGLRCDLHVHTNISRCSHPYVTPDKYYEVARSAGLDTLGFTNHMWDLSVESPYTWGEDYDVPSILEIKKQLGSHEGLRILIGCETEFPGLLGITEEHAKEFDYVMVSVSHLHQPQVTQGLTLESAADVRTVLIERTLTAAYQASKLPVPVVISHPFYPLGYYDLTDEVLAGIPDRMYNEIFTTLRDLGVGLELHSRMLGCGDIKDNNAARVERVRFYRTAINCGCKFTIGGDCHMPEYFKEVRENMDMALKELRVTEENLMEI